MSAHYQLIAGMESRIDVLETELTYLDQLLKQVGFTDGVSTLKETALELLRNPSCEPPFEAC